MKLIEVLNGIINQEKCEGCPLKGKRKPLVIKPSHPEEVEVVVVTESPWQKVESVERLTSIANIHTYPYIYCLLSGNFKPRENVYWTMFVNAI